MGSSTNFAEIPAAGTATPASADQASCELLRALARRPSDAQLEPIGRLAAKIQDWEALVNLAQEHRVEPMLFQLLQKLDQVVPSSTEQRLHAAFDRSVYHNLSSAAEMIGLLQAFELESIPVMPFKGVVLAASVYGDLTMRPCGDLDLLIHHRHLQQATSVMLQRGYELETPLREDGVPVIEGTCEYHFERKRDGMVAELRWRLDLVHSRYKRELGLDWAWPNRRIALLAGAEVQNMSPETMLLMLCMHGSKHIWSRLIWICDVAQLVDVETSLNWNEAIREAMKFGLWRPFALGVLLAHRVAGADVPQFVVKRCEADATACSLARHIVLNLFEAPGSVSQGGVSYSIKLLGFRERLSLMLSLAWIRPNERDFESVELPRSLHLLYWLVRPIRILRQMLGRS